MNERTNDPEHGLGTSPLLGPPAPRAWGKPRCALGATGPNHLLRRPGGARPVQGGKAVLATASPLRTQARVPTLPGGHFLPRLLATAGSVVDIPGSCGAGLSPEPRRPRDGKSGVSAAKAVGSRSFLEGRQGDLGRTRR